MSLTDSSRIPIGIVVVLAVVGCTPAVASPTSAPSPTHANPSPPPPNAATPRAQVPPALVAIARYTVVQPVSDGGGVKHLAFTPDGMTLISQTDSGMTALWDVVTGDLIVQLTGAGYFSAGMALSPDGKLLATGNCAIRASSGCGQFEILLWDMANREVVGQPLRLDFAGATTPSLLFSPDAKTVAALQSGTTGSGKVQLLDAASGQAAATPRAGDVQFTSVAFSPDGEYMALGSVGGVIYLWSVREGQVSKEFVGEKGAVVQVAFGPNGKSLASQILVPSATQPVLKILLWDLEQSHPSVQVLAGGDSPAGKMVVGIALSPDGKRLASVDGSGAIMLWDVASHQALGQPLVAPATTGAPGAAMSLAFGPDGETLAAGTDDGAITLWDIATSSLTP